MSDISNIVIGYRSPLTKRKYTLSNFLRDHNLHNSDLGQLSKRELARIRLKVATIETNYFHQLMRHQTYVCPGEVSIMGEEYNDENTIHDKERYKIEKQLSAIKGVSDKRLWLKYFAATNALKELEKIPYTN